MLEGLHRKVQPFSFLLTEPKAKSGCNPTGLLEQLDLMRRTLALTAGFVLALGCAARADTTRICIVPVKDGAPTAADAGDTWRIHSTTFRIPGLPALVFTPDNRAGEWTIGGDRRLVPYAGPFPKTYFDLDGWVTEPWSSRIVAVTSGDGVSVLRPGADRFETIDASAAGRGSRYLNVAVLPRRKQTIVFDSGGDGAPFVVEEASLRPWLSPVGLAVHGVNGVYSMHDAPSLSATIVLDLDRNIHVLADDGSWQKVGSVGAKDYGRVIDAPSSGAALFIANKSVIAIRRDEHSLPRFSADTLATTRANGAGFQFPVSRLFGRALTYQGAGFFDRHPRWRQLGPAGMEDIPGGDIGIANADFGPQIQDLPTLGRTLVRGRDGLYFYDGTAIVPVPRSASSSIGRFPRVHDLPSLGRVIVSSEYGLFELTRDGLTAKAMPFPMIGLPAFQIADWPEAGVALASTRTGIYALDRDLNATPVPGGDRIGPTYLEFSVGTNPGTGEMVLSGSAGLFLAVRAQDGSCAP